MSKNHNSACMCVRDYQQRSPSPHEHPNPHIENLLTCQNSLESALLHQATPAPVSKTCAHASQGGAQPRRTAGPEVPRQHYWKEQITVNEPLYSPKQEEHTRWEWQTWAAAGGSAEPSSDELSCFSAASTYRDQKKKDTRTTKGYFQPIETN